MTPLVRTRFGVPARSVTAVTLFALALNLLAYAVLGLLPDEAYYWVWSERLQAGYYDHPPLVAFAIRAATALFGDSVVAARLPALLSWVVGAVVVGALARRLYGTGAAPLAVLVWASLPITQIGAHIVTPDSVLIIFSALTYYAAVRAVESGGVGWWLAAGLCGGLAVAAKYTGVLVPVGIVIALSLSRPGRNKLAGPGPWLATVAALLAFAPVVWWNWANDWVSFAFQLGHGINPDPVEPLETFGLFLAGQLAVAAPWTWVAMVWAALRARAMPTNGPVPARHVLTVGFWLPLLLFGAAALTAKSHPNWPATAYLPGSVLLGGWLAGRLGFDGPGGRPRRGALTAVVIAGLASVLLVNGLRFPEWWRYVGLTLPAQRTQLSQAYGWEPLEAALRARLATLDDGHACTVVGNRLQTTSMIGWLLRDASRVTAASDTRTNQFHLWQAQTPIARERLCLYVEQFDSRRAIQAQVDLGWQGRFGRVDLIEVRTPDAVTRWYGLFVPEGDVAP